MALRPAGCGWLNTGAAMYILMGHGQLEDWVWGEAEGEGREGHTALGVGVTKTPAW